MDETTATVLVAAIAALGSIVTALFGWLTRKAVQYADTKTKILDEEYELERKESLKNKIVDTVTLAARSTMQTYVDEIKAKKADGKLTKEEAAEAFRRTADQATALLKREGVEIGRELLAITVEAVVGKLKLEGKNA